MTTLTPMRRPWVPYVVPFAAFMVWLAAAPALGLSPRAEGMLRVGTLAAVIALAAWPVLRTARLARPGASVLVGLGVFLLWIAPDLLVPGYRSGPLFQNGLTGTVGSTVPEAARGDALVIALRFARAAAIVPLVEELFWRGWLPRWLDRMDDFQAIPLGQFSRFSFIGTAALFALEHGAYWDVGLAAGVVYNWWMARTRSLGDLMLCHAATNAALGVWVVAGGWWEYW